MNTFIAARNSAYRRILFDRAVKVIIYYSLVNLRIFRAVYTCTGNAEAAGAGGKESAHPAKRHFYTGYTCGTDILVISTYFRLKKFELKGNVPR